MECTECPVCLEEFENERFVRLQNCTHKLCSDCFPQLIKCPLCRTEFEKPKPKSHDPIVFVYPNWNPLRYREGMAALQYSC